MQEFTYSVGEGARHYDDLVDIVESLKETEKQNLAQYI